MPSVSVLGCGFGHDLVAEAIGVDVGFYPAGVWVTVGFAFGDVGVHWFLVVLPGVEVVVVDFGSQHVVILRMSFL